MQRYYVSTVRGATLIVISILSVLLAPKVAQSIDDFGIATVVASLNRVKVAATDHYAKFGSFPLGDNTFELTLVQEGFLETPLSLSARKGNPTTNFHVRVVRALGPGARVTATNAAFNFEGGHTNQTTGALVVEAVLSNVASHDARELSLEIDGPELSSKSGEADLRGRVKFGTIRNNGFGEVHIYLLHWSGKR